MNKTTEIRIAFDGAWGDCENEAIFKFENDGVEITTLALGSRFSNISLTYRELCELVHELEYRDFKKRAAAQQKEKEKTPPGDSNGK